MTLLHLITRLSLGGSARNTIDSAAAAVRAGYRTILATGPSGFEHDVSDAAEQAGCKVIAIESFRRQISAVNDLKALIQSLRLIRDTHAEIVHTHTSKAGFVGRLAASLAGVPIVIHTPHGHIFHSYYGPALTRFFILLERFAARTTDRIVVLTNRGAEEHLAHGIGRREQYVAIPSGVDIDTLRAQTPPRKRAREMMGWAEQDLVILGVGRLVPVKGFDVALLAMPDVLKAVPSARLVLLGDGPDRNRIEELAREKQVSDRLAITGASEGVAPYLAAADVVVVPSRNEGMGRVIVEAMSLGVPVVASRVGGIPDVVEDGRCGRLVPSEDPRALARELTELLQNPSRRAEYGGCGRRRAELFSLPRMESLLLELYREVAAEKGFKAPQTPSGPAFAGM